MSAIDQYQHELLDFFHCPSDHDLVFENPTRKIGIYRLLQDIPPEEENFAGKAGDILVGGGNGEAEAMRISPEISIKFFFEEDYDDFTDKDTLVKSFWSPNFAFKLGTGLLKLGWEPHQDMEYWLAEKVTLQLYKKGLL